MKCGIYKITNQVNGKVYIGQSINISSRWRAEKSAAFNPNNAEYDCYRSRAFRKYGVENFIFEIIEECLPKDLNKKEAYWADFYNSYIPNGYNEALCGEQSKHTTRLKNYDEVYQIINDLRYTDLTGIEIGKKYGVSDQTISDINRGRCWYISDETYPIRKKQKTQKYCAICGKPIGTKATYCIDCANHVNRIVERPSKEQLLKEVATSTFVAVGKKYGVSDKAIVKWCASYGLPTHKKELKELYMRETSRMVK